MMPPTAFVNDPEQRLIAVEPGSAKASVPVFVHDAVLPVPHDCDTPIG